MFLHIWIRSFFCYTNMSEFLCYYSLLCKCAKNFNRTLIRMKASMMMMMMIVDSQTRHHFCYSCLLSTKINTMIDRTFVICFMGFISWSVIFEYLEFINFLRVFLIFTIYSLELSISHFIMKERKRYHVDLTRNHIKKNFYQ